MKIVKNILTFKPLRALYFCLAIGLACSGVCYAWTGSPYLARGVIDYSESAFFMTVFLVVNVLNLLLTAACVLFGFRDMSGREIRRSAWIVIAATPVLVALSIHFCERQLGFTPLNYLGWHWLQLRERFDTLIVPYYIYNATTLRFALLLLNLTAVFFLFARGKENVAPGTDTVAANIKKIVTYKPLRALYFCFAIGLASSALLFVALSFRTGMSRGMWGYWLAGKEFDVMRMLVTVAPVTDTVWDFGPARMWLRHTVGILLAVNLGMTAVCALFGFRDMTSREVRKSAAIAALFTFVLCAVGDLLKGGPYMVRYFASVRYSSYLTQMCSYGYTYVAFHEMTGDTGELFYNLGLALRYFNLTAILFLFARSKRAAKTEDRPEA